MHYRLSTSWSHRSSRSSFRFADIRWLAGVGVLLLAAGVSGQELPEPVVEVEQQPFVAATNRLIEALDYVGAPLPAGELKKLRAAMKLPNGIEAVAKMQAILDRRCLAYVTINPESRVSVKEGLVAKELVQQGWTSFLIKVHNGAGITPALQGW